MAGGLTETSPAPAALSRASTAGGRLGAAEGGEGKSESRTAAQSPSSAPSTSSTQSPSSSTPPPSSSPPPPPLASAGTSSASKLSSSYSGFGTAPPGAGAAAEERASRRRRRRGSHTARDSGWGGRWARCVVVSPAPRARARPPPDTVGTCEHRTPRLLISLNPRF